MSLFFALLTIAGGALLLGFLFITMLREMWLMAREREWGWLIAYVGGLLAVFGYVGYLATR